VSVTTPEVEVARTIEQRARHAGQIGDAHARMKILHDLVPQIDEIRADIIRGRALAAYEANQAGVSYNQLAAALGGSKSLVQKLVADGARIAAGADPIRTPYKASDTARALEALALYEDEDWSYSRIATLLGVSRTRAKDLVAQGRDLAN